MVSKKRVKQRNLRINVLVGVNALIVVILLLRLFSIQVLKHGRYTALAQDQYWNLSVIPAKRGDIRSSDDFVLAGTQIHYLLYLEPKKVDDIYKAAHDLSDVLAKYRLSELEKDAEEIGETETDYDEAHIFQRYYDKMLEDLESDLYWVIVEHNLTPVQKEEIEALGIDGIGFEEEPVRYYPEDTLCSHVLGFVAFNEQGEKQGYFGMEGALNGDLKGKPGRILEERDALGNPILVGGYKKSAPIEGRDIVLTVNRTIQYMVEKELARGIEEYDAKSGSVIVMDPFTGEVLAMANYPTYNPSVFDYEDIEDPDSHRKPFERKNLAISQTYEPGSVMKPFTVSAAIETGKVTPNTTFNDKGPVQYSDYVIDNWDGKHHGVQTIVQLLEKSNNIGAAWVGHLVGAKDLAHYLKEFGFGKRTEIELEGEDTGVIRDYETWTDIDLATASFGQGLSATPLQVINGFNVFANGGFLLQPKIVSKIIDEDEVIEMPTKQIDRVISKETADTMTSMLNSAAESGEASYFMIKNYKISGKTGTAQIPVGGKYDPEKTNATFVGYLTESKKFTMLVKLEEPRASVYAAETAVPLWMDIADELVKYFGIPPDEVPST